MKGAIPTSVILVLGVMLLVFALLYTGVGFGVKMMYSWLDSAPLVIQDILSGSLSALSFTTAEATVTHKLPISLPLEIKLTSESIFVKPTQREYYPRTEIKRGGRITLETPQPIKFLRKSGQSIDTKSAIIDPNFQDTIIVSNIPNLNIGVE